MGIEIAWIIPNVKKRSRLSLLGNALILVKGIHNKGMTLVASPCLVPRNLYLKIIAMFMFRSAVMGSSAEEIPLEKRENHTHTVNERYDTSSVATCLVN